MPRFPSSLPRTLPKTLHFFDRPFNSSHHRLLCTTTSVTAGEKVSSLGDDADQLIHRFSEAVKHFSRPSPTPSPPVPPAAQTRPTHPFDYNALMKSSSSDADEVLRLFHEMKTSGCALDVACYSTVVDTLVNACRAEDAIAVFSEMVSSRLVPDAAAYTILVKLYACRLNQFDLAYEVIRWMVKCGCSPDVFTYSTLIAGLCQVGRVEEAWGVLDLMLEEGCCPNVYTFTPMIQAYCYVGRIREAGRLLDTMESIGCSPNTVTYNIWIEALCKVGRFDEIEKLLAESRSKGWEPDSITYSTYMDGLCKQGEVDVAFQQLEVMLANRIQPNAVTLNILLDGLCRSSRAWEAKSLLERSAELEWDVSVVNYNTVMSRLRETRGRLGVLKLFTDMIKKGIDPNTRTVSIVIHALCKAGKLRKAKCILDSQGCVANVVTYTTLIHYFYLAGKFDEVHLLYSKMLMKNISPNLVFYNIMIGCLCREGRFLEAIGCFQRSLVDGFSPHLASRLIYEMVRGGRLREMLNFIDKMLQQGFIMDTCIYHSLIKAFCRMGYCQGIEIYNVCHVIDKMLGMR